MTNIYDASLKIVRGNETNTIYASLDAIMAQHNEFIECGVKADDVMNILYDASPSFRLALELTVVNQSKKKISVPSEREIFASYKQVLRCRNLQTDFITVSDYEDVRYILAADYGIFAPTITNQLTLSQAHYWDDIFQNGSLDDSDYDLLVDIDQIGKKFFESFTTPAQTLFYALPSLSSLTETQGDWWFLPSSWSVSYLLSSGQNSTTPSWSTGLLPSQNDTNLLLESPVFNDPSIKDFIQQNNEQLFPPSNLYALPASQCASGVVADLILPDNALMAPEAYSDYLNNFFDLGSANPELDNPPAIPYIAWGTWSSPAIYPSGTPNQWVEDAIDGIGGECGQSCNGLSEGEQQNCLNTCQRSCTAKCDDISLVDATDKAYCYSQCLCIVAGWPVGDTRAGMENMYKIKFCTVPVSQGRVVGGKKVYSIEAIFNEIKRVLDSLLNGWEIIKRTKPKEYFDTSLSEIKFSDLISFQLTLQVKALFPNISRSTQAKQLSQLNSTYETAILWAHPDDKNKYIVVANVLQTKVDAENITDPDKYNARIASLSGIEAKSTPRLPDLVANANTQMLVNLNEKVRSFMISNLNFWEITSQNLSEIAALAGLLKEWVK